MLTSGPLGWMALGIAVLVALMVGGGWLFARLYCTPRRRPPDSAPADHGLPSVPVQFHSRGVPLRGWYVPAECGSTPHPAVVVAHGWSSNASHMLPVARRLHAAGFGVLLYDARGHGMSGGDGPITIRKFAEDLLAAVDYLQSLPAVDPARLGVVGHSIGGGGAILAASIEPRIRAVASISAFADPRTLTRDFMGVLRVPRGPLLWLVCRFIERWLGTTMSDVSPQNRVGRIGAPLLLAHGTSDRFVPVSNLEALFARADRSRTWSWPVPGRRHWDVVLDPDLGGRLAGFFGTHLLDGAPEHRADAPVDATGTADVAARPPVATADRDAKSQCEEERCTRSGKISNTAPAGC